MAITEEERHELYLGLEEAIGRQRATTLMEHLPPVGWADVATKRDLEHFATQLRLEFQTEIGGLKGGMGALRGEMGALKGELGEFAAGIYRRMNTWGISLVLAQAATSALIINVLR